MKTSFKVTGILILLIALAIVSWVASVDSFGMASEMKFGDPYLIPKYSTSAIMLTAFILIAGYKYIESFANYIIEGVIEDLNKDDEEE